MLAAVLQSVLNTTTILQGIAIYSFGNFVLENPRDEPVPSASISLWTTNHEHSYAGDTVQKLHSYSCYTTPQS